MSWIGVVDVIANYVAEGGVVDGAVVDCNQECGSMVVMMGLFV